MSTLRVLSRHGDDGYRWDPRRVAFGDPEALAAVREAERIFAEARARGGSAFRIEHGRPATRLETFDPQAEEIVLMPRVIGG
jgi:hypothetical protein